MAETPSVPVPSTIERRLSWRAALPGLVIAGATAAVLVAAGVHVGSLPVGLLGLACLLCLCYLVAMQTRARTVIGPAGIHDRRPFTGEVFIPWTDVAEVGLFGRPRRAVRIARLEGRSPRTLSAVREGDVGPEGLGIEELAQVILDRARAAQGLGGPAGHES